ncbi:MAG TPA: hypothetical protein VIN40_02575 [Candidatus Tyrphobacter sp.]
MRAGVLLALFALAGAVSCGGDQAPYATSVGILRPHEMITVRIRQGTVNAYAPAVGQPADRFTISAYAQTPSTSPYAPAIRPVRDGIQIDAPALRSLLVRVPQGVDLTVISGGGDVNVTDISGNARVFATSGSIALMLPGYASASLSRGGTISVTMGSTDWPGTLRFVNPSGDVDLSVNENARFHARLRTRSGTIFTDFSLRGTSHGKSESIDGPVNGGAGRGIDVECAGGMIRLLRLAPQI